MVYFASVPSDLPESMNSFVRMISDNLEHYDLSMLDRPNCVVTRERTDHSDWVRVNLPHKQELDFGLHLYLENNGCIIFFADAYMHFDTGDDWREKAMDFLSMLLLGQVKSRSYFANERQTRTDVFVQNPNDEWERIHFEVYQIGCLFGRRTVRCRHVCFASEQDLARMTLMERPDDGVPKLELPGNRYLKKRPAELPPKALMFFDLLCNQLEKHQPPLLDERRTRAYQGKDSDGVEYLRISLPHKTEKHYYLGADVYADHCVLFYGNGLMRLDDAEWLDMAGSMLGELLFGQIEVRSVYRGNRLSFVTTRFLSVGKRGRSWTRHLRRWPFGKKRVDVKRVDYFANSDDARTM